LNESENIKSFNCDWKPVPSCFEQLIGANLTKLSRS
jgi:hypothetical protein